MDVNSADTICAIATAPGGALGIIRVSGTQAVIIVDRIFRADHGANSLNERKANTITYGRVYDRTGDLVDEVLVSLFRAPHSYTGEDSVEISCHGSSFIMQRIIELLVGEGARLARPGEYTRRAFANGKMDLSQAEAVADLIASKTAASHRIAMSQMRGAYSEGLRQLREQLVHFSSLLELELDFSDHEDLEFADRTELEALSQRISERLTKLCQSYSWGNALKNGIPVAIVGETNVGKSTLLNALLGDERAIVSDVHGTTRDVIEDVAVINGVAYRFIDTAGIRHTSDTVEKMGINRTFEKIGQAEITLWVLDISHARQQYAALSSHIIPRLKSGSSLFIVLNKADECRDSAELKEIVTSMQLQVPSDSHILAISARNQSDVEVLRKHLSALSPKITENDMIVSNARHYEALKHALDAINRVREGLSGNIPSDLVSQDLRECLYHLSDIIGEVSTAEVLENVFGNFCVGK